MNRSPVNLALERLGHDANTVPPFAAELIPARLRAGTVVRERQPLNSVWAFCTLARLNKGTVTREAQF